MWPLVSLLSLDSQDSLCNPAPITFFMFDLGPHFASKAVPDARKIDSCVCTVQMQEWGNYS